MSEENISKDQNESNEQKEPYDEDIVQEDVVQYDESDVTDNNTEASCQSKIETLEKEKDEVTARLHRTHSDFQNIQKRLEREKSTAIEYCLESFCKNLLPVIDSLHMALQNSDESNELKKGVEVTLNQFINVLKNQGIIEIECTGEFDPNIHEAVMRVDSKEMQSGHIVEVLQKGYTYKTRTLRAAMVSIAN